MIIAKNICKSYNGVPVLNNIDLHIKKGEFVSIMGESGSGKSTLLGILGGNIKPSCGEVYIDSSCVTSADAKAPYQALSYMRQPWWEDFQNSDRQDPGP